MEWMGFVCLIILLCYSSYPGKLKRLEKQVKKLERVQNGGTAMSKLISSLVGKTCKLKTDEALLLSGGTELTCQIVDADDEWVQFTYTDKKAGQKIRLLRIDTIESIEIIEE